MAAPVLSQPYGEVPPCWVGDPSVLVFAVRYALTVRGQVPAFVCQSIGQNVHNLPVSVRAKIVKDVRAWLAYDGATAPGEDRAVWESVLTTLGVSS